MAQEASAPNCSMLVLDGGWLDTTAVEKGPTWCLTTKSIANPLTNLDTLGKCIFLLAIGVDWDYYYYVGTLHMGSAMTFQTGPLQNQGLRLIFGSAMNMVDSWPRSSGILSLTFLSQICMKVWFRQVRLQFSHWWQLRYVLYQIVHTCLTCVWGWSYVCCPPTQYLHFDLFSRNPSAHYQDCMVHSP